ncbi:class Ib ribonucleoside-diphosphate reductase assembly flavoprotein NrdI [Bdellovibrio sp. HCB209]|uniref:class Ib ribonucleoside-diphosphate reductase assembly flavoprotein NrdI n=1 Tax=Bdellovibrio sp. HCB209 TaxID=3394354 RepID=UPI0039B54EDC
MNNEPLVVYFSSRSKNTFRFINKLGIRSLRIPGDSPDKVSSAELHVTEPFVLVVPTYAGHDGKGAVPKDVIQFLNDESNRKLLRGVIATGNRNFGSLYACAGDVISARCQVPYLYRFELAGTNEDVNAVKNLIERNVQWNL